MDRGAAGGVLREIRTPYTLGTMGGRTDAELLERSLARGESGTDDAFATLDARHGPVVRGVCRRMRAASHDADYYLPGDIPRPDAPGRDVRPSGPDGELALRRRGADRPR